MEQFKKDFYLGAATAAHQVEGNNVHSDYWLQEQMPHGSFACKSEAACDHYNRYKEDIKLLANAGLNAYRFSIEWARIEPKEGEFVKEELEHYKDVIKCCKENNVEPIVTLHHFTSPAWLITKGGWEADTTVDYFARYVEYVMKNIDEELNYICTINEANMGIQIATIMERYKKQMMAAAATQKDNSDGKVQMGLNLEKIMENQKLVAQENMEAFGTPNPQIFNSTPRSEHGDELIMMAHKKAKEIIKKYYPNTKVGLTLSLHDIQYVEGGEKIAKEEWSKEFTHYLPYIKDDDFLGVQNYTRSVYDTNGLMATPSGAKLTQMDYEYYPQGLEHVLRKVSEDFKNELLITENGIATANDEDRVSFIKEALQGIKNCINDNLPIKGYCYWSLMDNFEWQKGYAMQFGLIAIDRNTLERSPKPSLNYLGTFLEK